MIVGIKTYYVSYLLIGVDNVSSCHQGRLWVVYIDTQPRGNFDEFESTRTWGYISYCALLTSVVDCCGDILVAYGKFSY